MQSGLELSQKQRSHVLFVLSNPAHDRSAEFLQWYRGAFHQTVVGTAGVLGGQLYEQHETDISLGRLPRVPFHYLALYELSIDGAEQAQGLIDLVTNLHLQQDAAQPPATWLYYPASEKVGRSPKQTPSMLTLAFANGIPGQEAQFREWYATRHIRHALYVPALVSGQCLERTLFQKPGAMEARFNTIAIYEQEGTPEEMLTSFAELIPTGVFRFPMMDQTRFSEWVYRPL